MMGRRGEQWSLFYQFRLDITEFGGGYFPNDLKQFCTMAKLSAPPQVTVISTDGIPTNSKDGAEGEVMLDIEVAAKP
jgi:kumamolisin